MNVSYINGLCISGDTLYFAANCVVGQKEDVNPATGEPNLDENGEPYMYDVYEPRLFRMDSETQEITMLEGYKPPQVPEGMQGSASVNSITAGTDGTIWINEQMYTYAYNIPEDFDPIPMTSGSITKKGRTPPGIFSWTPTATPWTPGSWDRKTAM